MKELILNEEESQVLLEQGYIEIERNGFLLSLTENSNFNKNKKESVFNRKYLVNIVDTFDKIIINEDK
jgi:hypothetical protein